MRCLKVLLERGSFTLHEVEIYHSTISCTFLLTFNLHIYSKFIIGVLFDIKILEISKSPYLISFLLVKIMKEGRMEWKAPTCTISEGDTGVVCFHRSSLHSWLYILKRNFLHLLSEGFDDVKRS